MLYPVLLNLCLILVPPAKSTSDSDIVLPISKRRDIQGELFMQGSDNLCSVLVRTTQENKMKRVRPILLEFKTPSERRTDLETADLAIADQGHPPETVNNPPYFKIFFRMSRKFSQVTPFHVTYPPKNVFSSAKIYDDLFSHVFHVL